MVLKKDKRKVFLGLGTNLGDLDSNLNQAIDIIGEKTRVVKISKFFKSKPWGNSALYEFLNAVILVETTLNPLELLRYVKSIEDKMGRVKSQSKHYENRVIDIDIIMYEDLVLETSELIIPHKFMTEREFVLKPILELQADLIHPKYKQPLINYLAEIPD